MKVLDSCFYQKSFLLCLICLACAFSASAQISSGGTPPSQALSIALAVPTINLPVTGIADFLAEDEQAPKDVPFRFGVPIEVSFSLNSSGTWTQLSGGDRLWRLHIASPGAYSINLIFDQFYMPEGAQFFVYNENYDYVIGAFTSANNKDHGMFSTQPVPGDFITLEYYEPAAVQGQGLLSVMRVVHAYRNLFGYADNLDSFGDSGACNNNVACDTGWDNEERGAVMLLTSGGFRYCSGSLINNTANDGQPYILTANHCGPGPTDVAMFNYQSPTCTPNQDGPTTMTVSSGTERFFHSDSDVSLWELSSNVPLTYNPYFNGWNANDIPATQSVCIHHPSGDVKKITWDFDTALHSTWSGTPPNSHWRIATWEDGTTEPGSSGSPLFDENHRITGQLHGGEANCSNNVNDYFGKFSLSMTLGLRPWLDPASSGIMTLDGYDPNVAGRVVGVVTDASTNSPIAGALVATTTGTPATFTNGSGEYNLPLSDGTYDLEYSKWGYEAHTELGITITEGDTIVRDVPLTALPIIDVLDEDFETGAPGWTHEAAAGWGDDWHLSTERSRSATHSWKCGDTGAGTYSASLDARLMSPVLSDLPADAQLTFWMQIQSEVSSFYPDSAYDGGIIEVSVNGGAFAQVNPVPGYMHTFRYESGGGNPASNPMPGFHCFAGLNAVWTQYTVDLSEQEGQQIQFRFRFGSDAGAQQEGWYIDDVLIQAVGSGVNPQELTIEVSGSDAILRWAADSNPFYRIYAHSSPVGEFPVFIGSTDQNTFTIVNGATASQRFYYVVGALTP